VAAFTEREADLLRASLQQLLADAAALARARPALLKSEARRLGDEVLELERFVQLNQAGFVKIIKKHDKTNPSSPVWHLYFHHLQHQPWVHCGHADLWSLVSAAFYQLHASGAVRRAATATAAPPTAAAAAAAGTSSGTSAAAPGAAAAAAAAAAGAAAKAAAGATKQPRTVLKYWVSLEDVSQVVYFILQHMPLLPADSQSLTAGGQQKQRQRPAFGLSHVAAHGGAAGGGAAAPAVATAVGAAAALGSSQSSRVDFPGCSAEIHTVYLDNSQSLELYHGRLYLRPNARTVKVRWMGRGDGGGDGRGTGGRAAGKRRRGGGDFDDGGDDEIMSEDEEEEEQEEEEAADWVPRHVVVERKIYREGWKGEPNTKDAMLMAGEVLPSYLAGTYTLSDALEQMHPSLIEVEGQGTGPSGGGQGAGPPASRAASSSLQGALAAAAAAFTEGGTGGAPSPFAAKSTQQTMLGPFAAAGGRRWGRGQQQFHQHVVGPNGGRRAEWAVASAGGCDWVAAGRAFVFQLAG